MTRPSVALAFTGGLRTPSGTRFMVTVDGYRALFDLGMAFTPATNFFDGRVQARPQRMLTDLLALGLAPPLPRLYSAEALGAHSPLPPGPDERTAVFVSHLHLDHVSLLPFVADEIPIYMSEESVALAHSLEDAGLGSGLGGRLQPLPAGGTVELGELRVTLMPVDHDIEGAAGFLVDTPEGTVVYTGDIRTHGYRAAATEAFIAAAAGRRPRVLVIETTRLGEEVASTLSEAQVVEESIRAVSDAPGLALVVPYPRNVERLERLPEIAQQAGRRLVVEAAIARLLTSRLPADVAVYEDEAVGREALGPGALQKHPERYLLQLSYRQLATLLDIRPPPGSILIHSDGEPLGPFDPGFTNLQRWLERLRVEHRMIRSSGHASPPELVRLAAAIGPEVVFPLHGFRPDLLILPGVRQVLPSLDVAHRLDGSVAG